MLFRKKKIIIFLQIAKIGLFFIIPAILATVSLDNLEKKHSICLIKNIFGVECYGCGLSKAIIACIQLDFVRAFHYNKLIVIVMPLIIYLSIKEIMKSVKKIKTL